MSSVDSASLPASHVSSLPGSQRASRIIPADDSANVAPRTVSEVILIPRDDIECESRKRLKIGREMMVGRGDKADLRVAGDRWMSRRHFSIECTATHAVVKDLCSGNGTFINGARAFQADVYEGDHITAGTTVFVVRFLKR